MLKVLLVDDHPLFRQGVRVALAGVPDLEVVGEADNGVDAVRLTERLRPDVVLMDLGMPGGSGVDATRRISTGEFGARVLVVTMSEEDESLLAALAAGARGYLLKGVGRDELLAGVRAVASGTTVFGDQVAERLTGLLPTAAAPRMPIEGFGRLTGREFEVLELIAQGRDNRWIARQLTLSDKTVRNHVSNVFDKLGVASRAEAIVLARNAGLGGAG